MSSSLHSSVLQTLRRFRSESVARLDAGAWLRARAVGSVLALAGVVLSSLFNEPRCLYWTASISVCASLAIAFYHARKVPTLFRIIRRLEERVGSIRGVLIGASDLERGAYSGESVELAERTIELARETLEAIEGLSREERALVGLGRVYDLRKERVFTRANRAICAILLGLGAFSFSANDFSARVAEPVDATIERVDATEKNESASNDLRELADVANRNETDDNSENASESKASLRELLDALRAALGRATGAFEALNAEIFEDVELANRLASEGAFYLDDEEEGARSLTERALASLERTDADARFELRLTDGRETRAFLLRENLRDFTRFQTQAQMLRDELTDALGTLLRSNASEERRVAQENAKRLIAILTTNFRAEERALEIFARAERLNEELDALDADRASLYRRAVDLLRRRAGAEPTEDKTARATREREAFVEAALSLERRIAGLDDSLEELRRALTAENARAFFDFIKRLASETRTDATLFDDRNAIYALTFRETRVAFCRECATNARLERWGKATTILQASWLAKNVSSEIQEERQDAEDDARALACALIFGASRDWKESRFEESRESLREQAERTERVDEVASGEQIEEGDAEGTTEKDERVANASDAQSGYGTPTTLEPSDSEAIEDRRERSTGTLFDLGAFPDASFVGGSGEKELNSFDDKGKDDRAFLPGLARERVKRVELAEEWTPSEEAKEQTKRFQRRLKSVARP